MRRELCLLCLCFFPALLTQCGEEQIPEDPVEEIVAHFGVSRERVLAVVEKNGVDPDGIDMYGPYYFPFNYYEYRFEQFEAEHGRPPRRSEVEEIVTGYVAKCAVGDPPKTVQYIYYSDQVHPRRLSPWSEVALAFTVGYEMGEWGKPYPEDPTVVGMYWTDLYDGSVNPPSNMGWERCIEEYRTGSGSEN